MRDACLEQTWRMLLSASMRCSKKRERKNHGGASIELIVELVVEVAVDDSDGVWEKSAGILLGAG